jgi:hypothetical protein
MIRVGGNVMIRVGGKVMIRVGGKVRVGGVGGKVSGMTSEIGKCQTPFCCDNSAVIELR